MPKLIFAMLLVGLTLSCNSGGSAIDPNSRLIQQARNAYFAMDHSVAYSIFTNVWKDTAQTLDDRTLAGVYLAKMNWLFYNRNVRAYDMLDSLGQINHNQTRKYLLKARILADELRMDEAIAASELAIQQSTSDTEKYRALLSYCTHIFNKCKKQIFTGTMPSTADSLELKKGNAIIQELKNNNSGDVDVAKLSLGYCLLLQCGAQAFREWMSYYRLTDINQVHRSLIRSPDTFKNALDGYVDTPIEDTESDIIIKGLGESGFYELAMLVKKQQYGDRPHTDPFINEIAYYYEFLQQIKVITGDFYVQTIVGKENKGKYRDALLAEGRILWDKLSWSENPPTFSEENFTKEIRKRFKAVLKFIEANGYYGLHMGHVVLDDKKLITQYQESAEFRYVAIDHMVSNGYSGWFWDGEAETGGWADDDESFLQVRSAYTAGPIRSWQAVTDSIEIIKTVRKIRELSMVDDSLAAVDPYSYLPGLSERINYNEKKELLHSLVNKGLNGSELRLNFINALESMVLKSSIYAHEGRHAIDKKNKYAGRSEELEYRAKLSEIYFADNPLLAFNAILSRNIGDGTTHGNANLRVIQGLVKWMEANKDKITDFDSARPALPQIDRLTDEQLKSAIKQMDPMAK